METSSRAGWFAVMLGILLPGLGHVYIRQFGKGFVLNILGWGATSLTFLMVRDTAIAPVNLVLAAPWIPGFYFYMSRDAYLAARQNFLLHASAYDGRLPEPGDVVYFQYPINRDMSFVQRCIATEGQIVTIENGVVYVDGIRFDEPEGVQPVPENFGPEVVPDGHFFVLGDNRRVSADSRSFGPVPRGHLLGKAVQKLVARDAHSGEIRLDRIGEVLD